MIYSKLVKIACDVMFDAHKDDVDKGGYPYVFHPWHLAEQMSTEDEVCAALLHDVVEDHGDQYSIERLRKMGFSDATMDALELLTHRDEEYLEYVKKLSGNQIARKIKLADLEHNMDASRIDGVVRKKNELYKEAYSFLKSLEQ